MEPGKNMRYVILRDDDANALTPVHCLERLYRPWLDRSLPVNLAVIPNVRTDVTTPDMQPEGFLLGHRGPARALPVGSNQDLVAYLHANPGFKVLQHGYHHELFEFDCQDPAEVRRRLDEGRRLFADAGFRAPQTFVAPYDRFSRTSLAEAAQQFRVVSTGWFEAARLPYAWWPKYAWEKLSGAPHWRAGQASLLTHPGCLLSRARPVDSILDCVFDEIERNRLTVLVTHWWEYFPDGKANDRFISVLHETADRLANRRDLSVVSFDDVASGKTPLN
jgi:hypothetical protein